MAKVITNPVDTMSDALVASKLYEYVIYSQYKEFEVLIETQSKAKRNWKYILNEWHLQQESSNISNVPMLIKAINVHFPARVVELMLKHGVKCD